MLSEKPKPPLALSRVYQSQGPDHAVVYVDGWLSHRSWAKNEREAWVNALREAGFQGAIYHLWWDAPTSRSLKPKRLAKSGLGAAMLASGPVGKALVGVAAIGGRVLNHFRKSRKRAKKLGRVKTDPELAKIPEQTFSLVGFSLGAQLIFEFLMNLDACEGRVDDVVLLGAAIRRDSKHDWGKAADSIQGNLVNMHSESDQVLKRLYRILRHGNAAAGSKPIKLKHDRIRNIDVSDVVRPGKFKWKHLRSPKRFKKSHRYDLYLAQLKTRAGHLLKDHSEAD